MSGNTKIEWTEATWNPVTGCSKISLGCENCYAERIAKRLKAMGQPNYKNGFQVTTHDHVLATPLKWKSPRMIFVNSMGDLFHDKVPDDFILKVFDVMSQSTQHVFQVLTKRPERFEQLSTSLPLLPNVWLGVTVESMDYTFRIDHLKNTQAPVKFLSIEPLLGPMIGLNLDGIDWTIVGGESGPNARPMNAEWVKSLRDQCLTAKVAFFFKQWGGPAKKRAGRILEGRTWDQIPEANLIQLTLAV